MKPIIMDMAEMSDSTEVYGSRPSPILSGVIYCMCALLVVAMIWMNFFQIDEVVRSSGMVKSSDATASISGLSSGKITEYRMEDDTYVEEGTVLFQLDTSEAAMQKANTENELQDLDNKIQILEAYLKELNGERGALGVLIDNPYYAQYENRWSLIQTNCKAIGLETQGVREQYSTNIENLENVMQSSRAEEAKLNQMLACIKSRTNTFADSDLYYYSTVANYINTYNSTATNYDVQIQELEEIATEENDMSKNISALQQEKEASLNKLEQEMVASIEKSLLSAQATTTDISSSMLQAQSELDSVNSGTESISKDKIINNEIATIYSELNTCLGQKSEYEKNLETLNHAIEQGKVVAQCSGYLNLYQENTVGDYLVGGTELGTIIPAGDGVYKVQIYLANQDIGKVEEGTNVKFEIGAYPSSEYGQSTGIITKISEDLKVNQDTGKGYYLAEATIVLPDTDEKIELKQGMAVEAKVIVGQKSVMRFLLEKLDLIFDI